MLENKIFFAFAEECELPENHFFPFPPRKSRILELTLWITRYFLYKSLAYAVPNTGCPQGKNRISLELWNCTWRNVVTLHTPILKF